MVFLYPNDPLQSRLPDEVYKEEYESALSAGLDARLFSYEELLGGRFVTKTPLASSDEVLYRGWMLSPHEYHELSQHIRKTGAVMKTSPLAYELCHYLPRWYDLLSEYTPETLFFAETDDIASSLRSLGWSGCFLKDYVKSLSTAEGSLVKNLDEIPAVIAKMRKYRGSIEGGICARQIEAFLPDTETRHFVLNGIPHSLSGETPDIVKAAAQRIESPFFSVDVISNTVEELRIVELGDGQVSDRKDWPVSSFLKIFE